MHEYECIDLINGCLDLRTHTAAGQLKDTEERKYMEPFRLKRTKSKQAHTWYQRAHLRGVCVLLPCQGGSVCGGRSCVCACWWVRAARRGSAGSAATGPRGRRSRDTRGQSRSSAAHSSRGQRSPSGRLKWTGS